MTLPRGEEITEHFGAHWLQLASRLPAHQQRVLNGPRTEQQRLIELQLVLDTAILVGSGRFLQCGERGVTVVKEDGSRFWFVAFADMGAALPGLPADAHEMLDMARQVYDPVTEAVVALLLPEQRVRLLYLAHDGIRGQIYQRGGRSAPPSARGPGKRATERPSAERGSRARATSARRSEPPPTKVGAPKLIGDATVTPTGYLIRVAHPERGLLGQITLTQINPEHMLVETSVSGHADDPTTAERRELLLPAMTALQQSFAAVRGDRAAARSIINSVLTRGAVPADIPRRVAWQALPCTRCGRPAFFLAFAEDNDLMLDDYGRILFELMRDHGVPAWVVRGSPAGFGPTEARQLYPARGPVLRVTMDSLDAIVGAACEGHCG